MNRNNKKVKYGATGIILGMLCVTFICLVEVFGPGSYTTTGSSIIYLDGTVTTKVQRPLLPLIAGVAFYSCFISFLFGITSVAKKEVLAVSLVALSFGFAPIFIYILGTTVVIVFYVGLLLLLAATSW